VTYVTRRREIGMLLNPVCSDWAALFARWLQGFARTLGKAAVSCSLSRWRGCRLSLTGKGREPTNAVLAQRTGRLAMLILRQSASRRTPGLQPKDNAAYEAPRKPRLVQKIKHDAIACIPGNITRSRTRRSCTAMAHVEALGCPKMKSFYPEGKPCALKQKT
jgi:hypothetical protein